MEGVSRKMGEFSVFCHCRRVRGKFFCKKEVTAWDCNCSDCIMRGNVHIIVPESDFTLDMQPGETFEDATTLYEWGTKTAKRRFCKTCGILAWYIPRSNPDGIAITLNCIDWNNETGKTPQIEIKKFDGVHWEESYNACKIKNQSDSD